MTELQPGQLWHHDQTGTVILLLKSDIDSRTRYGNTVTWTCQWWNYGEARIEDFSQEGILKFWRQLNDA